MHAPPPGWMSLMSAGNGSTRADRSSVSSIMSRCHSRSRCARELQIAIRGWRSEWNDWDGVRPSSCLIRIRSRFNLLSSFFGSSRKKHDNIKAFHCRLAPRQELKSLPNESSTICCGIATDLLVQKMSRLAGGNQVFFEGFRIQENFVVRILS